MQENWSVEVFPTHFCSLLEIKVALRERKNSEVTEKVS